MRFTALCIILLAACTTHIAPYREKHRKYDSGDYGEAPKRSGASLYADNGRGLFEDDRAGRVGDVVVVIVDEDTRATQDSSTNAERSSKMELGIPSSMGILGALQAAHPGVDPSKLIGASSESSFAGGGGVSRKGRLAATLPVRVRRVLPNGDLFVEGTKVVMVGNEESHLYLSGVVRPIDIRADDTVPSSRIADAEIEYTGRGDVSGYERPGWLARALNKLWPF